MMNGNRIRYQKFQEPARLKVCDVHGSIKLAIGYFSTSRARQVSEKKYSDFIYDLGYVLVLLAICFDYFRECARAVHRTLSTTVVGHEIA
jgi:hypothetical protein